MKDTGYIQIQGWMINHLSLKPNELIAFAIIFGFSQDKVSYFTGSLKYLENAINVSKGTVISILKTLIERELILKRSNTINGVTFNDYAWTCK
ncbi:helix-turn-helix domain-containing protein [Sphingobacterium multivorum]|uniref:helix-turn-helix domain-containing protein n=1 Tax=Sphingobacterium multivorum TaxID=28454 RepID=UPI003DA2F605